MKNIIDPTIAEPTQEKINYAPRPTGFKSLRIGLIENTTRNAETVLRMIAGRLERIHGMKIEMVIHKAQRAALKADQIAELKGNTDFAIVGVGA